MWTMWHLLVVLPCYVAGTSWMPVDQSALYGLVYADRYPPTMGESSLILAAEMANDFGLASPSLSILQIITRRRGRRGARWWKTTTWPRSSMRRREKSPQGWIEILNWTSTSPILLSMKLGPSWMEARAPSGHSRRWGEKRRKRRQQSNLRRKKQQQLKTPFTGHSLEFRSDFNCLPFLPLEVSTASGQYWTTWTMSSTNVSGNSIVSSFLTFIMWKYHSLSVIDVDLIRAVVDFFYDGFRSKELLPRENPISVKENEEDEKIRNLSTYVVSGLLDKQVIPSFHTTLKANKKQRQQKGSWWSPSGLCQSCFLRGGKLLQRTEGICSLLHVSININITCLCPFWRFILGRIDYMFQ